MITLYTKRYYFVSKSIAYILFVALANATLIQFELYKNAKILLLSNIIKFTIQIIFNKYMARNDDYVLTILQSISESYILWPLIICYSSYSYVISTLLMFIPYIYIVYNQSEYKNSIIIAFDTSTYYDDMPLPGKINFKSIFKRNFLKTLNKYVDINLFMDINRNSILTDFNKYIDNKKVNIIYNVPVIILDDLIKKLQNSYGEINVEN